MDSTDSALPLPHPGPPPSVGEGEGGGHRSHIRDNRATPPPPRSPLGWKLDVVGPCPHLQKFQELLPREVGLFQDSEGSASLQIFTMERNGDESRPVRVPAEAVGSVRPSVSAPSPALPSASCPLPALHTSADAVNRGTS